MPAYTYACPACGHVLWQMRQIASRDDAKGCPKCSSGVLTRLLDATQGLLSGSLQGHQEATYQSRLAGPTTVNGWIENMTVDNCGGGIRMDGGHIVVRNLQVTNTPSVFDLHNGATVDATNIVYRASTNERSSKKTRSRRKRQP